MQIKRSLFRNESGMKGKEFKEFVDTVKTEKKALQVLDVIERMENANRGIKEKDLLIVVRDMMSKENSKVDKVHGGSKNWTKDQQKAYINFLEHERNEKTQGLFKGYVKGEKKQLLDAIKSGDKGKLESLSSKNVIDENARRENYLTKRLLTLKEHVKGTKTEKTEIFKVARSINIRYSKARSSSFGYQVAYNMKEKGMSEEEAVQYLRDINKGHISGYFEKTR